MHITTAVAASTLALATGAAAMLATPAQTTQQPGQMTKAQVWIENRGPDEAIPVDLRAVNLDRPVKVQIINGDSQYAPNAVPVRPVRQLWDYQTVTLALGEDMAQKLNQLGAAGWETTGVLSVDVEGATKLLLKRPR
jgi:hypothetical protein